MDLDGKTKKRKDMEDEFAAASKRRRPEVSRGAVNVAAIHTAPNSLGRMMTRTP